jgi:succinate dehydrogenase flavin-adding protein (antitoxin of CptAB toxin-antitoxin module)
VLDFLAQLNENPYLVGIEELKIKCDPKKRGEVELDLTVSSFAKQER